MVNLLGPGGKIYLQPCLVDLAMALFIKRFLVQGIAIAHCLLKLLSGIKTHDLTSMARSYNVGYASFSYWIHLCWSTSFVAPRVATHLLFTKVLSLVTLFLLFPLSFKQFGLCIFDVVNNS
jgi:hypothetical protein